MLRGTKDLMLPTTITGSLPRPRWYPLKFGTIGPELLALPVQDKHYKSIKDRILAIPEALNEELHSLADAGCPVIQFEEPQIHLLSIRKIVDDVINPAFSVDVFNRTVKGLRAKTEV